MAVRRVKTGCWSACVATCIRIPLPRIQAVLDPIPYGKPIATAQQPAHVREDAEARRTVSRVAGLLKRLVQRDWGCSEDLCPRDHHVTLNPVILINPVFVDVEPVRGVRETG